MKNEINKRNDIICSMFWQKQINKDVLKAAKQADLANTQPLK